MSVEVMRVYLPLGSVRADQDGRIVYVGRRGSHPYPVGWIHPGSIAGLEVALKSGVAVSRGLRAGAGASLDRIDRSYDTYWQRARIARWVRRMAERTAIVLIPDKSWSWFSQGVESRSLDLPPSVWRDLDAEADRLGITTSEVLRKLAVAHFSTQLPLARQAN